MNKRYVKMFRENYADRLFSGIEKLESEIQNACSVEEAFNRISEAEFICRYLEINPENRNISQLKKRQVPTPPYSVQVRNKYKTLGEAVEDFREQAGVSQLELGNAVGISARTIYRLEKGKEDKPSEKTIKRVLGVFDIHPLDKKEELYRLPTKK